jgi:hypothetical protein
VTTAGRYTLSARRAPVLIAGAAVLLSGAVAWPFTVDDAFIVARYARNLALGHGYAMNPGEPSDGVTGPLWLLPGWLAVRAGLDPIAVSKVVGIACTVLATVLVVLRVRERALGSRAAGAASLLLAVSPSLGSWGVSGLETGLATLCLAWATLAALARRAPRPLGLGLAVAALAWLRPELALASLVLLAGACARDRRAGLRAGLLATVSAAAVVLFRSLAFGNALPLALSAKPAELDNGLGYALVALALATSFAGAVLAFVGARRGRSDDRVLGLTLLAHLVAVVLAGGDWMPGYRLLVPILPLYAALAGVGFARLSLRSRRGALALLLLASSVPVLDFATRVPDLRRGAELGAKTSELGRWLGSHARAVALVDVGRIGYESGLPVLDLGGLTDPAVARLPGGHLDKKVTERELRARGVDAIVLHGTRPPRIDGEGRLAGLSGFPVENRVAALRYVRERFRAARVHEHGPGYHYVVLLQIAPR